MSSQTVQIGPFTQILTLKGTREGGSLKDENLDILKDMWITVKKGKISHFSPSRDKNIEAHVLSTPSVATPGLIDAHTHLCFAGSRAHDYALRLSGVSYQEIAAQGGGILETVRKTRKCGVEELVTHVKERLSQLMHKGVTTVEIKSGYGLSLESELNMLRAIKKCALSHPLRIIPTCLAAHTVPPEALSAEAYLENLVTTLLPKVQQEQLAQRVDIFIEKGAFTVEQARDYLKAARALGFQLTVHADQFSRGGSALAAELNAVSADHLEQSTHKDFEALAKAGVSPILLPGATLGLGMPFPPARQVLDSGLPLAIASDWNPGSAPMGQLITQASLMGASEKLTMAETWAAITSRAARALDLKDRGMLLSGQCADIAIWPINDWREILYQQGSLVPSEVWIGGELIDA